MNNKYVLWDKFRKPIILLIDIICIKLSVYSAFMIRFDWQLGHGLLSSCWYFMFWASIIRISLFLIFGMYQWSFRYASLNEALNIVKAVTIGSLLLISVAFFNKNFIIGRSVLLIDYLICLFLIVTSRFLPRILIRLSQNRSKNLKRVLIVGAGAAGEMIVRELINTKDKIYNPVGFIDDNSTKHHSRIHGIKVLGGTNDIKDIVKTFGIEEIIIAIPSASGKSVREIVSKCEKAGIKIKTIPALHKILTGEVSIKQIKDVDVEDLLGRESVEIDKKNIDDFISDKIILVTGAGGTIGSELCRQIVKFDPRMLLLYDYNENNTYFLQRELEEQYSYLKIKVIIGDIKDIGLLKHTFSKNRPQIVFHSGAHKHVPLMEDNLAAAVKNNIIGTRNLMYAAEHYKVESFVMISTDKAVNPTSIMGMSKRIAEMMVQAKAQTAKTKFMSVRFGNVIGSSGSVVPIFKQQIEKGGPVTVTHPEIKRYFMTAGEAAQLVIEAGTIGKGGEVFILDMGEQIKIKDLAENLITLSGLELGRDIDLKFIGLRIGEKLYEETLLDVEHDKATKHDKIYIAQPGNFNAKKLRRDIKELERLAVLMAEERIIAKMKEMVPCYKGKVVKEGKIGQS